MADGLFFCATLTGRRGGHTPFVQAVAETSDTGAEGVKPDPGSSWEGHFGGGAGFGDENAESCRVVRPLRIPLVIRPLRRNKMMKHGHSRGTSLWSSVVVFSVCSIKTNHRYVLL